MRLTIHLYHSQGNMSAIGKHDSSRRSSSSPTSLAESALKDAAENGWDSFFFQVTDYSVRSDVYILRDKRSAIKLSTDDGTLAEIKTCLSKLSDNLTYQLTPARETQIRKDYHMDGFLACLPHSRKLIFIDSNDEVPEPFKLRYYGDTPRTQYSQRTPERAPTISATFDNDAQERMAELARLLSSAMQHIQIKNPNNNGTYYNTSDYAHITTLSFPEYTQIKPELSNAKVKNSIISFLSQHPQMTGKVSPTGSIMAEFSSPAIRCTINYNLDDFVSGLIHNMLLWGIPITVQAFEQALAVGEISALEVYVLNVNGLPSGEIAPGVQILQSISSSSEIWPFTTTAQELDINNHCGTDAYMLRSILIVERSINICFHAPDHTTNLLEHKFEGEFSVPDFLRSLSLVATTNLRPQFSWVKAGIEAGITPPLGRSKGPSGDVHRDINEEDMRKAFAMSQAELAADVKEICDFAIDQKIRARSGDFRHTLKNIFTTLELIYIKDSERGSKKDKLARRMAAHLGTVKQTALTEIVEGLYDQRTTANHSGDLNVIFVDTVVVDGDEVAVGRLVEHLELLCTEVIEKLILDNDLTTLSQIIEADIANAPKKQNKRRKRR